MEGAAHTERIVLCVVLGVGEGGGGLTFLGVEEEEGLVEGDGVVILRRRRRVVTWHGLDDEGHESSNEESGEKASQDVAEELAAADHASKVHILLLLLLGRAQEPALLSLLQPLKCRPIHVQVAAAIVIRG